MTPLQAKTPHDTHSTHYDVNYAIHLHVVDMLMSTYKLPPRGLWPDEYGVMKLKTVPQGIWAQTFMPFRGGKKYDDYVGKPD